MKRIYQRQSVSSKEMKEINKLSKELPSMKELGVTPKYHVGRLRAIVLEKYRAKSRKDRDQQMSAAFKKYADGIFDLNVIYQVQREKGFEPNKVVKTDVYDECYQCGVKDVFPLTSTESDTRYACKACGAIHVPKGKNVEVYHVSIKEEPHNVSDN